MTRVSITRKINVRDPNVLPAWRLGMAPWEWKHLPSAKLSLVTPTINPGGTLGFRVDGYNGIAVDPATNRCFLAGMGGHADYAGNEAYLLDLSDAEPAWQILRQPTPSAQILSDASYYADGRPSSTHTYYSQHFIAALNRIFRFGSGSNWGSGNFGDHKVNAFNLTTGDWDAAGTWADITTGGSIASLTCCQDPATGDVYVSSQAGGWFKYSGADGSRTVLSEPGYFWRKSPSAVDTTRNRILVVGEEGSPAQCKFYDIAAGTWGAEITATGPTASQWSGLALEYSADLDRFVKKTYTAGEIILIHPETLVCTPQSVTGTTVTNGTSNSGIWNRFRYLPNLGGFIYYPAEYAVSTGMFFLATE